MKKILIMFLILSLVSCGVEGQFNGQAKTINNEALINISKVDVDTMGYDDLIEMFGQPDQYRWENNIYDADDLPRYFIMSYGNAVHFFIKDLNIMEMRVNSDEVAYDELYCGQSMDEALTFLTAPDEVLDGYHLYFKEGVLYRNAVDKSDGHVSYYDDQDSQVRIWFYDDIVTNIYYTSKYYYEQENNFIRGYEETTDYYLSYRANKGEENGDDRLKAKWLYKDYVFDLNEFDPKRQRSDHFNFIDLDIQDNGIITNSYLYWETGRIISVHKPLEEIYRYDYLEIDQVEYLILTTDYGHWAGGYWIFEKQVLDN